MFLKDDISHGYVPFPEKRAAFYKEQGCWENRTHFDLLKENANKFSDKVAVIQNEKQLTYQMLYEYAIHYGSYLKQKGIKETDFILVQSANVIEVFVVIFALYYIGARPVFCLDGHGSYEIENIAKQSRAVGYIRIVDQNNQKDARLITTRFKQPNFSLWFRQTIVSQNTLSESFSMLADIPKDFNLGAQATSTDIAFLQLSGGTTGLPKLIPRTHADYIYSVKESVIAAHLHDQIKQLIVLPVMHNFTMSSPGFLGVFYVGGTVVLSQQSHPRVCFEIIEKYKINQVSVVPAIANLWVNSESRSEYDCSSLNVIQVGGAKLLPTLAQKIVDIFDVKLQQVYGMAEGLVNFTSLDDSLEIILNTQGKKLSIYDEIRIVNHKDEMVELGQQGLIQTRGPYTINGYYNLPEINRRAFTEDGFYKTGDIGYLDNLGNIIVTGREKEQINRSGEKITPSEIEEFLLHHPVIKDVCVIGVEDQYLGERIKALIIPKQNDDQITLRDIRKFLINKNISTFKIPDEIEIVTDFQYTHVGKVNRQKL